MAFTVKLQSNASETNAVTKSITDVLTLTGTLKNESSVIDPVIIVEADPETVVGCNYMTIPSFNRAYFIRNITVIRANIVELRGHVDVLSTYASAIKANTAIIDRQETNWNLYIDDGSFKAYANPIVETIEFPNGFSSHSYVMAYVGGWSLNEPDPEPGEGGE